MSWHFLQGREVASWEAGSLDGAPSALSSLIPTAAASSSPDSATESYPDSPSGTTFGPSTGGRGADTSMSSPVDFRVRTSPSPEPATDLKERAADSGWRWPGSFAKFDQDLSLWKTRQCSLLGGLDEFLETWPRWGSMRSGECLERTMLELGTVASESGLLPTPCAQDWQPICWDRAEKIVRGLRPRKDAGGGVSDLQDASAVWWLRRNGRSERPPRGMRPRANPSFWEWMMGWPVGWTDCAPLGTDKFRQWCASHGVRWERVDP